MLSSEIEKELIHGLCDIFQDKIYQIIIYGSVARKEATSESDIDIAVVLDGNLSEDNRKKFIDFAAELDLKYERIFSIIDIEQSNFDKWGKVLPFYRNIQEEGIVLWKSA